MWLDNCPELKSSVEKRLEVINGAIRWFRERELPVIDVYHEERSLGVLQGTKVFEFPDTIDIKDSDIRVVKHHPDAFGGTGLEDILRSKGCDSVVITGLSASGCVLGTFFGASNFGIASYVLKGGIASHSEDHVRFAEEVCDTATLEKLDSELRKTR